MIWTVSWFAIPIYSKNVFFKISQKMPIFWSFAGDIKNPQFSFFQNLFKKFIKHLYKHIKYQPKGPRRANFLSELESAKN